MKDYKRRCPDFEEAAVGGAFTSGVATTGVGRIGDGTGFGASCFTGVGFASEHAIRTTKARKKIQSG